MSRPRFQFYRTVFAAIVVSFLGKPVWGLPLAAKASIPWIHPVFCLLSAMVVLALLGYFTQVGFFNWLVPFGYGYATVLMYFVLDEWVGITEDFAVYVIYGSLLPHAIVISVIGATVIPRIVGLQWDVVACLFYLYMMFINFAMGAMTFAHSWGDLDWGRG